MEVPFGQHADQGLPEGALHAAAVCSECSVEAGFGWCSMGLRFYRPRVGGDGAAPAGCRICSVRAAVWPAGRLAGTQARQQRQQRQWHVSNMSFALIPWLQV